MIEALFICLASLAVWVAYNRGMENGLCLAVLFLISLPLQIRFELGGAIPQFSINRIMIILIVLMYLTRRNIPRANKGIKTNDENKFIPTNLMLAYLLSIFVSTIVSVNFTVSVKKSLSNFVEMLLLFIIIPKCIQREDFFGKFLVGLVIVGIIVSSIGIIQRKLEWDPITIIAPKFYDSEVLPAPYHPGEPINPAAIGSMAYRPLMDASRGLRPNSTLPHPILLGAFLVMIWPFSIVLLTYSKYRLRRIIAWIYQLLMVACVYFTMSRGPWLGWILAFFILFLFKSRGMRSQLIKFFFLILLLFIIKPGSFSTLQRIWGDTLAPRSIQGSYNPLASSAGYRFDLIKVGVAAVLSDPLRFIVGFGPGTFPLLGLVGEIAGQPRVFWSTDCSYIRLLVCTGVCGIGFLLAMLFTILRRIFKEYSKTAECRKWILQASLTSIFVFFFMMTNVDLYGWQVGYFLWSILGMTIALLGRDMDVNSISI